MAAEIKGTAVCWAVDGISYAATALTGASMVQSMRRGNTSERAQIKDGAGDVKTLVYHGKMKTLALTVVPSDSSTPTIADARASRDNHMNVLLPGLKVTLTDTTSVSPTSTWILVSANENRTNEGLTTIDLELENADTDLSTSAA